MKSRVIIGYRKSEEQSAIP